jgi:hypothetical protein
MTEEREQTVDGVTVSKSLDTEGFPVPTVTFDIVSDREDHVLLRIVDRIPESFPMDSVGFHPEYGSENWTAYPDQRVEYEREIAPDESVTTIYGIRLDDTDEAEQFLGDPEVETLTPGDESGDADEEGLGDSTIADIAPPERTEVVRDVIEGERDTVPGLEDGEEDPEDILGELGDPIDGEAPAADGEATENPSGEEQPVEEDILASDDPREDEESDAETTAESPVADDPLAEVGDDAETADEDEAEAADEDGGAADESGDEETDDTAVAAVDEEATGADGENAADATDADGDEAENVTGTDEQEAAEASGTAAEIASPDAADPESTAGSLSASPGNVAAALAEELAAGHVDDETRATLREELGVGGISKSADTRLSHLQSRMSDMEAYADAMEAFIDENGTARELLDRVETDLADLQARTDDLEADLTETVDERMSEARTERERIREDLDALETDLEEEVGALDGDLRSLEDDLNVLRERVEDVETDLGDDVATVEEDVAALREDVAEFREWRSQLSSVFGGEE